MRIDRRRNTMVVAAVLVTICWLTAPARAGGLLVVPGSGSGSAGSLIISQETTIEPADVAVIEPLR